MPVRSDHVRVQTVIVDLVNSAAHGAQPESMGNVDDLSTFIERWKVTEVPPPTAEDLKTLHRLRAKLRSIFVAPDMKTKIEILNAILGSAELHPRLVEHGDLPLHVHYFLPYTPLGEHMVADCAMQLVMMFENGEASRLKVCQAPGCETAFVDRSKNRSRLYCDSQSCGNRLHAAAYRARLAAS
ncbi:CGNR zinc finger domain-containing protein [Jiangella gansuensis]|uniref:CGNR zinc finger domain-containing protein n=1 Tax=Jiangella gansuensis TaxID=281473 RepID=UPI00047B1ED7|nr:CGNR zinc finger domain-containing protein [Jiangella gansuensis]